MAEHFDPAISNSSRIDQERRTVAVMIEMYCRAHHTADGLCPRCVALQDYALQRIARCPFGEEKPTCANCRVHCYRPEQRMQIKEVMRFSGPRMLLRHPVLALLHLADGRKKVKGKDALR